MTAPNIGLVLTGGGARAAYQAGVLQGIAELTARRGPAIPFRTIAGISAGSINAAYFAGRAGSFVDAAAGARRLWGTLRSEDVVRTDAASLSLLSARWIRDLSLGGAFSGSRTTYLLNTRPLAALLERELDFQAIDANLKEGRLEGLAISATHYKTGTAVTYYGSRRPVQPWVRSSRLGKPAALSIDHVLASASMPILFQPVKMAGSYHGDGSIRMRAPLSPAIHLGAERILAIGIRHYRHENMTLELNANGTMPGITIADIAGIMLNAAFMDSLEDDAERMERINATLAHMTPELRQAHPRGLRPVPLLVIRPSRDLGAMAIDQFRRFPTMLRHLLKGIGASDERGSDLLSYLAFDSSYTGPLLDLGYGDAMDQREEIIEFLS